MSRITTLSLIVLHSHTKLDACDRSQLESSHAELSSLKSTLDSVEGERETIASALAQAREELSSSAREMAQMRSDLLATKGSEGALAQKEEREAQLQAAQLELQALQSTQYETEAKCGLEDFFILSRSGMFAPPYHPLTLPPSPGCLTPRRSSKWPWMS